jgi:hypothetical protein
MTIREPGNAWERGACTVISSAPAVSGSWPKWALHLGVLMGRLSTWTVMYRNADLRDWLEARSPSFAAYCKDRDLDAEYDDQLRRTAAECDDRPGQVRYVRCTECGCKLLDPMIRTEEQATTLRDIIAR